jgi:hypothetical protein
MSNIIPIRAVGSEFVPCGRTDGQRDVTKLIVASRNFANAPKNFKPEIYINYSRTPLIRIAIYPDRLDRSGKFVNNSTKLTYLKITGYRINCSTVLWFLERQIGRGHNV